VRRRLLLFLVALVAATAPAAAHGEAVARELMPGVTYTREVKSVRGRPVVVHVVTAPRPGGLYRLAPVLGGGTLTARERVSAMQERLSEQATVVGVNGDLSNIAQGYPSGILLRDGVLHARPTSGRSSLGIGLDGLLRLERVGFAGTWGIGDEVRKGLSQLNRPLDGPGVGLFTRSWGASTPKGSGLLDVVIGGFPAAVPNVDLAGQIVEVRPGGGTSIPQDGAVLQARGSRRAEVSSAVAGMPFVVKLILKPWWEQVEDAIGGGPALVRNGRIVLPTKEQFTADQLRGRHPHTAVGQLADGRIVLVAVDGRSAQSAGMTMWDLARELRDRGVVTGMSLDGGGSTTLAFDGDVLNTPSDGSERSVTNALMVLYYGVYAPAPRAAVLSPNGDGVAEEQGLAYKLVRPSTVSVRLVGPGGKVLLKESGPREAGTYPFSPDPDGLAEGRWRWLVSAVDDQGNRSDAKREFSVNNTLGFLELSKGRIGRGGRLAVSFELEHNARLAVTVENARGRLIRTIFAAWRKHGDVELSWNGRSGSGKLVSAGRYTIRVEADNRLGAVELAAGVTVARR
jgi:hypothetical protein